VDRHLAHDASRAAIVILRHSPTPRAPCMSEPHQLRLSPLRLGILGGSILVVPAIRAQFVGYPSFEPVLFARIYVYAFSILILGVPTFVTTFRQLEAKHAPLLLAAAILGGVLLAQAAPTIGEPNYCGYENEWRRFDRIPPKTFRCTSTPFEIAGGLAGWWLAFWLAEKWQAWRSRAL
jgi:hypothetical protein